MTLSPFIAFISPLQERGDGVKYVRVTNTGWDRFALECPPLDRHFAITEAQGVLWERLKKVLPGWQADLM
ncbi:hypothetical protein BOQ63_000140 (plasmid) [Streptomyces viridifaciens]|nr:hypothetical protein BOQ63_000140 [Streptomyces viridifaciens]